MPIITIGVERYDSDLLSNKSKELLIALAEQDVTITRLKEALAQAKQDRKTLSKDAMQSIESAKIG